MHVNENSNQPQARKEDGELRFTVAFSKTVPDTSMKKVQERPTFGNSYRYSTIFGS